jgi:hypothetical protein
MATPVFVVRSSGCPVGVRRWRQSTQPANHRYNGRLGEANALIRAVG